MDEIGMSMKHLQKLKDHENEPRSEYGNLPPELRALKGAMEMVFNAVTNAAPSESGLPAQEGSLCAMADKSGTPKVAAPRRMDIETAIMRAPGFDYLLASEIFAALQRRLELRYENNLNTEIAERMQKLAKSFNYVMG